MTAEIYTWRDTSHNDYRALIDEDGEPVTASRADNRDTLNLQVSAIVATETKAGVRDMKVYELGELHAPSLPMVRRMARFMEAK